MKKLLTILLTFLSVHAISQPIVNRAGQANTVSDARWQAQYNMFTPRYFDTTAANLNLGIDSCGALVYTYTENALWFRQCSPKAWIKVAAGGVSPSGNFWALGGNTIYSQFIPRVWGIGALSQDSIGIMTSGVFRLKFYATALPVMSASDDSMLVRSANGYVGVRAIGGGGSSAISALTAATASNDINNVDYLQTWRWNSLSSFGLNLQSNSTAANNNESTVLNIETTGANSNSAQSTYGIQIRNTHSGTSSSTYGAYISVGSGTSLNTGAWINATGTGSTALQLGTPTSSLGNMKLAGNTSGLVEIKPAAAAGTWSLTLPTDDGTPGQFLQTDGSGVTSWQTSSGGGTPAGNNRNIQINDNGSFGSPGGDSLAMTGNNLSVKGGLKVTNLSSGANADSAVTYNTSTNLFNKRKQTVINANGRVNGDGIRWDAANSEYITATWPTASAFGLTRFQTGVTTNAPGAGDSSVTNTGWAYKRIITYREGLIQDSSATDGFTFAKATGVLTFHPPLSDSERIQVFAYDTLNVYDIALETPPIDWVDILPLTSSTGLTESPTNVYTAAGSSWADHGLSSLKLPASTDGGFIIQMVASTGTGDQIIGFNTSNSDQDYTNYEAGVFCAWNGGGSAILYSVENGTPTSLGGPFVSPGDYIGVFRVGSTLTIRTATTKYTTLSSWTTLFTFTVTSSANLYMNINANNAHSQKLYYPQCLNCQ